MAKTNYELAINSKRQFPDIRVELRNLGAKNIFTGTYKLEGFYIRFTAPNDKIATDIKTKFNNIKEI